MSRISTQRLLHIDLEFQEMLYRYIHGQSSSLYLAFTCHHFLLKTPPSSLVDSQHQTSRPASPPILTPANWPTARPNGFAGVCSDDICDRLARISICQFFIRMKFGDFYLFFQVQLTGNPGPDFAFLKRCGRLIFFSFSLCGSLL